MAAQHAQPLMEVKVPCACESIWDHAWFRVTVSRDAAAFVQNLAALQCASRCLTRRSKAVTDCCHLQAGKCASIHAEQLCCSSFSSRKHQVSRGAQAKSIWGLELKTKSLCVPACSLHWPSARVSTGSEERAAVLFLPNTLLQPLGIPTIFVI